jgi:DNA adenine methylase
MTYIEPFFGSGAVFFMKERSCVEIINDINCDVVNLFRCVRERADELAYKICYTPWSRGEYELSFKRSDDPVERARRFIVNSWFSFGSKGHFSKGSFRTIKKDNRSINGFSEMPYKILELSERLKSTPNSAVQIENINALTLIEKYNGKNIFMYLDPPYMPDTRKSKKLYEDELSDEAHEELLKIILDSGARILLSGYNNDLYHEKLSGWHCEKKTVLGELGMTHTECLWRNYTDAQDSLFNELSYDNAISNFGGLSCHGM